MKKVLFFAMLMFVFVSTGQTLSFGEFSQERVRMSHEDVTGQSPMAYKLMEYASSRRIVCMQESSTDVPSDKAEVILEAHRVFGEYVDIGVQMLLDADHMAYGELIYDWSSVYYGTYEEFEYKIPDNAEADAMTKNFILDGEGSVIIPAGVYDYMVVYPYAEDGIVFTQGEFSKYDDFEFKGGCTYRFLVEYGEYDMGGYVGYFPIAQLFTAIDAAVTSVTLPANGMDITDCEDVIIEIANRGEDAITQFAVSYQIDGGDIVTETFTETIAAGERVLYTFDKKADLSIEKVYEVKAWVSLDDDMIPSNDSATAKCKHIGVAQLPFYYDFSAMGEEAFMSDWTIQDKNGDDNGWMFNSWTAGADGESGAVSCSGCWTGDMTGNDNIVSLPIALKAGDNHIILNTRCINESTTELLDVLYGTTTNVDEMTTIAEFQVASTEWVKRVINFNVPTDGVYYIALHVHSVDGLNVFVDEILVDAGFFQVAPFLRIDRVVLPYSNCDLSDQSVVGATVTNIGTGPTSTFTLTYTVDKNIPVSEIFTDVLNPTESRTYYFKITADFAEIGDYEVLVESACSDEVEDAAYAVVSHLEPITTLPVNVDFITGENFDGVWSEMTPGTWERDEMFGTYGTSATGVENGLLSRCLALDKSIRMRLQYTKGGWMDASFYVAYGKADADVSTYTKVYEDGAIAEAKDVEFVIPITESDNYSIIIVNTSDGSNLYLGQMTISELLPNDLRLCGVSAPVALYTPQSQLVGDVVFTAEINNRGTETMTGVTASVMRGGVVIATSEPIASIAMDETIYIPVKATLPKHEVGNEVRFAMHVSCDTEDGYKEDNIYNLPMVMVTDTLYASECEDVIEQGTGDYSAGLYIGNIYELSATDVLSSITLGWAEAYSETEPVVTDNIGVAVYAVNDDMTLGRQLYQELYVRGMGGFVTYNIDPIKLEPGKYFFEVQQLTSNNMGIGIKVEEAGVCYQNVDNTLTAVSGATLMIRANFGHNAVAYDNDAAVVKLVSPVKKATLFTSNETITVRIKNKGAKAAEFNTTCKVNEQERTLLLNLQPYETIDVAFENYDMEAVGDYVVTVTTHLVGDENTANDTYTETLTTVEEANPFVMDFEYCYDFDAAPDRFNPGWRTVDRVGEETDYFWMFNHPYRGEGVGFMAFNINSTKPVITSDNLPGFYPHSGDRFGVAFCVGYDASTSISDVWLISPKLLLGTDCSLELFVKTRMLESYDAEEERYRILISDTDDDFDSFTILGDEVRTAPEAEWGLVTVDLKEYDNKEVYIAIQYIGERFKNVCLMVDDIEIKGNGLGSVTRVNITDASIRYNAVEEVISISAPETMRRVEVYNMQGQVVYAADIDNKATYRMSVSECTAGVYVVKVSTATSIATAKIVVR